MGSSVVLISLTFSNDFLINKTFNLLIANPLLFSIP